MLAYAGTYSIMPRGGCSSSRAHTARTRRWVTSSIESPRWTMRARSPRGWSCIWRGESTAPECRSPPRAWGSQVHCGAPGVRRQPANVGSAHRVPRLFEAVRGGFGVIVGGNHELPLEEPRVLLLRARCGRRPGVRAKVVVIAPGGEKERPRI